MNGKFQTFQRNSTSELLLEDSSKRTPSLSSEPSISAKTQMRGYKMCMPSTEKTVLCMGPSLLHHAKIIMRSSRLLRAFTRHTSPRRVNLQSPLNLIKDVSRDSKRGTQSTNHASASSKTNSKLYIGKGTKKLEKDREGLDHRRASMLSTSFLAAMM